MERGACTLQYIGSQKVRQSQKQHKQINSRNMPFHIASVRQIGLELWNKECVVSPLAFQDSFQQQTLFRIHRKNHYSMVSGIWINSFLFQCKLILFFGYILNSRAPFILSEKKIIVKMRGDLAHHSQKLLHHIRLNFLGIWTYACFKQKNTRKIISIP